MLVSLALVKATDLRERKTLHSNPLTKCQGIFASVERQNQKPIFLKLSNVLFILNLVTTLATLMSNFITPCPSLKQHLCGEERKPAAQVTVAHPDDLA